MVYFIDLYRNSLHTLCVIWSGPFCDRPCWCVMSLLILYALDPDQFVQKIDLCENPCKFKPLLVTSVQFYYELFLEHYFLFRMVKFCRILITWKTLTSCCNSAVSPEQKKTLYIRFGCNALEFSTPKTPNILWIRCSFCQPYCSVVSP